jgi:hypothetical protein
VPTTVLPEETLPTLRDVLGFCLENDSVSRTVEELLEKWQSFQISTICKYKVTKKLKRFMGEYRALKKDVVNYLEAVENRRKIFVEKSDSLFDISHASAQAIIKSKKIAKFLLDQQSIRVFKARDLNIVK